MKKIIVLAALFLSSAVALANPFLEATRKEPICFGREYSEKHMLSHDSQTVKNFRMKFQKSKYAPNSDSIILSLEANIKVDSEKINGEMVNRYEPFEALMFCFVENENEIHCGIECDGGSSEISWEKQKKSDEILFYNEGLTLQGGCGDDRKRIWLDPKKGGDDVFKLFRLRKEFCQE